MFNEVIGALELRFFFSLLLCVVFGFFIGLERESRGKDAGISTYTFVIAGSMLFTFLSSLDTESTSRIAAQVVTGIGFIGAGLIFKEGESVRNLTTAASIWFAAGIGMAIGFQHYLLAAVSAVIVMFLPKIPHYMDWKNVKQNKLAKKSSK